MRNNLRSWSLWAAISMGASVLVTEGVVAVFGADVWGRLNSSFAAVFDYLGLPTVSNYFSWTWASVWTIHAGLPFVVTCQACRTMSESIDSSKSIRRVYIDVALRFALVVLLLPAMVLFSRASLLLSPDFIVHRPEASSFVMRRIVFEAIVSLILGIPYVGAIALCERVIGCLRRRRHTS